MPEAFHFIRPLWLLALLPLALLAWRACRPGGDNPWQRIVDARLLPLLMVGQPQARGSRLRLGLLACGWLVATLALADPTWERRPAPVFQTSAARVVVLDLSSSMNAADLKPSRLARARYKVDDVLSLGAEGQTGLVVYAGDAFAVTPLTRDANTIRAQLDALAPDLMPIDGSRADLGLLKAEELLRHAGLSSGQVLLIADGVAPDALAATERAAARLKGDGYPVSVLAVGSEAGAPLPDGRGGLVRDAQGQVVMARMDAAALRAVAQAGGGVDLSVNDGIDALRRWIEAHGTSQAQAAERSDLSAQRWKEGGPLLVLLLLPLGALAFRRNWLLAILLLPLLAMHPRDAMASTWSDLWQRPDQQAARSLSAGDYATAARVATDAQRRGSAEYKRGNYQLALDNFAHASGGDADYNRGNALARLGRYADAIAAYDKALKEDPGNADARANEAAVEALLKQQQKEPQKEEGKGPNAPGKDQQSSTQASSGGKDSSSQGNAAKSGSAPGEAKSASSAQAGPSAQANGANAAASSPQQPGNEFAEAAKKLAAQGTKGGGDAGAAASSGVNPAQAAASAGATPRQGTARASGDAQPLPTEEQLAAEQWLRRIPDDPGGLLRRKFLYQYRQRAQQAASASSWL